MNPFHPKKLLHSKWTSTSPQQKEKHFLITEVEFDEDGNVIHCLIEAILTKRAFTINWRDLKNSQLWQQGWK